MTILHTYLFIIFFSICNEVTYLSNVLILNFVIIQLCLHEKKHSSFNQRLRCDSGSVVQLKISVNIVSHRIYKENNQWIHSVKRFCEDMDIPAPIQTQGLRLRNLSGAVHIMDEEFEAE